MQSEGIWIESTLFEPGPDEDAETNPGIFGKKFAEWIAETLQRSGYATEVHSRRLGLVCSLCT